MAIGERPPIVHEGWDKAEEYDEIIIRGFFILITPSPEENTKQEHLDVIFAPLRIKPLWLRPKLWVMMDGINWYHDGQSFWNFDPFDGAGFITISLCPRTEIK